MSQGATGEDLKDDQRAAMMKRLLQYPSRYKHKEEFLEFCVKKIVFTGKDEDVVLRKDFNEEFEKHSGVSILSYKAMGQHLTATGVRTVRITRRYVREYCYVGIRLADGKGRRYADFMDHRRTGDASTDNDATGQREEKGATPKSQSPSTIAVADFMDRRRTGDASPGDYANGQREEKEATPESQSPGTVAVSSSPQAPSEESQDIKTPRKRRSDPVLNISTSRQAAKDESHNIKNSRQLRPVAPSSISSLHNVQKEGSKVIKISRKRSPVATITISSSSQGQEEENQDVETSTERLPFASSTTSSSAQTPDSAIQPSEGNHDITTLQKLLNYSPQYKEKDAFIRFCRDNIIFTGNPTDFVFRKDLKDEFSKFLGGGMHSPTTVGMHLGSAGVMVSRLGARHNKEYGYRGMRFVDGRGRKRVTVGQPRTGKWCSSGRKQDEKQAGVGAAKKSKHYSRRKSKDREVSSSAMNSHLDQPNPASVHGPSSTPVLSPMPVFSPVPSSLVAPELAPVSTPDPSSAPVPPCAPAPTHVTTPYPFSVFASVPPPASTPGALNFTASSSTPLDLSLSTTPQAFSSQPQYQPVFSLPTVLHLHLPTPSPLPAHNKLPPPPPAHSQTKTPAPTHLQSHVNLAHSAPLPTPPSNSYVAPVHLLLPSQAYLTLPNP